MIDLATAKENIVNLVALASGLPVAQIKTIKGGKIPDRNGAYAAIKVVLDRSVGRPSPKYSASNTPFVLSEEIKVPTELQININFYRDGANQYANNMKGAAYRDAVRAFLFANNIGWANYGPVNDLTNYFAGDHEERANAKLYLWMDGLDTGQVGQATNVDVTVDANDTNPIETFYASDIQQNNELPVFEN